MTDIELLSIADAAKSSGWAGLCGSADLFTTGKWLAVEGSRSGPWVPADRGCLISSDGQRLIGGVTLQKFDRSVDDVIIRVDKMLKSHPAWSTLPPEELEEGLLPSLMCGGWFNSRILGAPGEQAGAARRDLIAAIITAGLQWESASVAFPYVDAMSIDLRADLQATGFVEIPAPNRFIFSSDYTSYEEYYSNVITAHSRHRIRTDLKKFYQDGVQVSHDPVDDSNVEQIAGLAHNLELKYGQTSTYNQIAAWFSVIAKNTQSTVFTAKSGDRLFAMSMWIHHEDRMYGFHCGFGQGLSRGLHAYSVVVYRIPIEFACSDPGIRYLEYGIGGDQAKLWRGAKAA